MPGSSFRVVDADEALADLDEVESYWNRRGEAWRGEKYHTDLLQRARSERSDAWTAAHGRPAKDVVAPGVREILVFGVYRIIYEIDEAAGVVNVLRFWHSHRDTPPLD